MCIYLHFNYIPIICLSHLNLNNTSVCISSKQVNKDFIYITVKTFALKELSSIQ